VGNDGEGAPPRRFGGHGSIGFFGKLGDHESPFIGKR
jgi:hypothetical protein